MTTPSESFRRAPATAKLSKVVMHAEAYSKQQGVVKARATLTLHFDLCARCARPAA